MAILNKTVSGMMLMDDFLDKNLLWKLSPNDFTRIACNNGKVDLEHGDERVSMSIPTPSQDYVFQAEVTHEPVTLSDVGGISINSTTGNSIECQTYYNGDGTIKYTRFIKVCAEKEVYTFFGSPDAITWHELGNSKMTDANTIGFFLDGIKTAMSKKFTIHNVSIYRSNVITISNLGLDVTIKIIDKDGNNLLTDKNSIIKHYDTKTYLDLSNMLLPLNNVSLQIFNSSNVKVAEYKDFEIVGGDMFEYDENIQFAINDVIIDTKNIYDLGRLRTKENIYNLTVKSLERDTLTGKKLSVIAYSDYCRGETNAALALEDLAIPNLVYVKTLDLPDMPKDKVINIKMKIAKDVHNLGPFLADKYKFKIVLE